MRTACTGIVWFRQDLRLSDNPALREASRTCDRIVPVYIHAPGEAGRWSPGGASRWWLHHSLARLDEGLRKLDSRLVIRTTSSSADEILSLARAAGADCIYWNRLYDPASIQRDTRIAQILQAGGHRVETFSASLLNEPWTALNRQGRPYRVFTPYWKACLEAGIERAILPGPRKLARVPDAIHSVTLERLGLVPTVGWAREMRGAWQPGESAARRRLKHFLDVSLTDYDVRRDIPSVDGTSRLSPYLHHGEISPAQIAGAVLERLASAKDARMSGGAEGLLRELGWREFGYHLLYHFPHTTDRPLDDRFAHFPWSKRFREPLRAWQQGRTGIPIVDAGMRQLWRIGWMHNRVRMIVASFLTKNLLIPWQEGARWFWDTLVDADLASNTLGWQWIAGCGADAAPYFRIFNPVTQGRRFDPEGRYVRQWVPEIAHLPDRHVHTPWQAPDDVLRKGGVTLGRSYPLPLIELRISRERALQRYAAMKNSSRHAT